MTKKLICIREHLPNECKKHSTFYEFNILENSEFRGRHPDCDYLSNYKLELFAFALLAKWNKQLPKDYKYTLKGFEYV